MTGGAPGRWRARLPTLLAAGLAVLGFFALSRLLHDVHFADVRAAWGSIGPWRLLLSVLFAGANYALLTLYDVLALRAIGRRIPYRTAAAASFTSYAISNNLGLAFLTGGSARYRIYSAEGLGAGDVARIVAIASLAFWSGLVALSALLLLTGARPDVQALAGLPPAVLPVLGAIVLGFLALAIAAAGRGGRRIALGRFHLKLPGRAIAFGELLVGVADLVTVSAILLVLVPGSAIGDWPAFFIGYVLAIVAAVLSMVPGGLGVFEAVILATLPGTARPELVAALLGYRLVYYLLPLLAAAVFVAIEEGRRWRQPAEAILRGGQAVASAAAPIAAAALTFVGGLVLLFSGSLPAIRGRMHFLRDLLPLPFIEVSHLAASLVGVALLLLAVGLYRRLDGASVLARALLLAGGLFSLLKGLDYEEAALMLAIAAVLQWTRAAFYRQTRLTREILSPFWLVLVALSVTLSVWIGLFSFKHVEYRNELWWQVSSEGDASRFLRASLLAAVFLLAVAIWQLLQPAYRPADDEPETPPAEALRLSERTDSNLVWTGDKRLITADSGRAFLMYQRKGRSWIVMGDPVGASDEWRALLWAIRERADARQGRLLLYQISSGALPAAVDLGLQIVKYGEEARVFLPSFTMDGPAARPLRYATRRAEKEGASFAVAEAADVPALLPELRAVSDVWLVEKGHREKGFSVGRFDPAYLCRFPCAVVRKEGRIVAFANVWATENHAELSIDLMRHGDAAPYGTMEYLFVQLMLWGRERGYQWFTLGLSPLAGLEARRLAPIWSRLGSLLYRRGASLYGFAGLRQFKDKFSPQWEPRFIAGSPGLAFGRALFDLQALVSGPPRRRR